MLVYCAVSITQIVYEDGDSEDMNCDEVNRALVPLQDVHSIDPEILETIRALAVEFDAQNPGALFKGVVEVAPADEDDEEEEGEGREDGRSVILLEDSDKEPTRSDSSDLRSSGGDGDSHAVTRHDEIVAVTGNGHCAPLPTGGGGASRRLEATSLLSPEFNALRALGQEKCTSLGKSGLSPLDSAILSTVQHENGVDIVYVLDDSNSSSSLPDST